LLRPLGESAAGGYLPFAALTAIHVGHRLGAVVLLPVVVAFALALTRHGPEGRRWGGRLAALAAWQLATGLSNVVLGWPMAAALAHTGGAAALAACVAVVIVRLRRQRPAERPGRVPASMSANAAP